MSTVAKQLLEDVNVCIEGKRALKQFIKDMGYTFADRHIVVNLERKDGPGRSRLIVHELLDNDDLKREVGLCFVYDREAENGVVLPFPYSKYASLTKKKKAVDS